MPDSVSSPRWFSWKAERLTEWMEALPLPANGPTGAVARFAARETQRLRHALRAPAEPAGGAA